MQAAKNLKYLFIEELSDMLNAEKQIISGLPNLIKVASSKELKEALTSHLKETEDQVTRILKIFNILHIESDEKECEAMKGLLSEAEEIISDKTKSSLLDAAIISAAQKVEHYEIAAYGTLRSFAKHLNLDSEITHLIQDSLDEEGAADKKLTKIAEGGLLSKGVNEEAELTKHKR